MDEIGYYDLNDVNVRAKQARLAKQYGIDGFLYHHYYFYEASLKGATLASPLERMLEDGEPNLPFAFHWANQDWSATWQGLGKVPNELFQPQNYPAHGSDQILEHYHFLRRFFHHPNYIRIHGAPLFMIFCTFDERVYPVLDRLKSLAIDDGFPYPGLHIPQYRIVTEHPTSLHPISLNISTRETLDQFHSDFYYPSNHKHSYRSSALPPFCLAGLKSNETRPIYLSAMTRFDNTPRRSAETANLWTRNWEEMGVVASFQRDLTNIMLYDMCCQDPSVANKGGRFVAVNAWNEWAEGMTLEPSDMFGYQFLEAVQAAKQKVSTNGCHFEKYDGITDSP